MSQISEAVPLGDSDNPPIENVEGTRSNRIQVRIALTVLLVSVVLSALGATSAASLILVAAFLFLIIKGVAGPMVRPSNNEEGGTAL